MARTKEKHTLIEAFNYQFGVSGSGMGPFYLLDAWLNNGQTPKLPWLTTISASNIDLDYMGNISGNKWCSPMIEYILKTDDTDVISIVSGRNRPSQIANILYARFGSNWNARYDALMTEYAPLENYSMTEQMEDDITEHEKGSVLTTTKTGTETATPDTEITVDGSIYGYDSSQPSPSDKSVTTNSGTNEVEYDTTETATGSGTDTDTRNYTLTRRGNIGVTTSQQMLQSELEVRMYDFLRSVFDDIDKVLTIPIY